MGIVLFDNKHRNKFLPLTATRAVAGLRMGIFTIKERWERVTRLRVFVHTEAYLMPLYAVIPPNEEHIWIDSSVMITDDLLNAIKSLETGFALADAMGLIAGKTNSHAAGFDITDSLKWFGKRFVKFDVTRLEYPHEIFQWNETFIKSDFEKITANRSSKRISATNNIINPSKVFLEEGVSMEYCTLNASAGPIYIGKDCKLMEGNFIRGPFTMGTNSLLKMGSKIYGATSFGPNCVAGGEIKNVVMQGNSNKAHDGYLGDSVIGEWCNFGAGTSNSNVKNTGGEVHIWNYAANNFIGVGQKCGLIMGDYSRAAINSCINTGSMIGICCNVFGAGLLSKVIADFSWGTIAKYEFDKAIKDINNWKKMKHQSLSKDEIGVLEYLFNKDSLINA